jgi:hypothetical protein
MKAVLVSSCLPETNASFFTRLESSRSYDFRHIIIEGIEQVGTWILNLATAITIRAHVLKENQGYKNRMSPSKGNGSLVAVNIGTQDQIIIVFMENNKESQWLMYHILSFHHYSVEE